MTKGQKLAMHVIRDEQEIPEFTSEREEATFWATHSFAPELIDRAEPIPDGELPPPRPRTQPVTIRLTSQTLRRLKALAAKRNIRYQILLEQFVRERLSEEEKREGLVGRTDHDR
jgi:hypothetical protein